MRAEWYRDDYPVGSHPTPPQKYCSIFYSHVELGGPYKPFIMGAYVFFISSVVLGNIAVFPPTTVP